MADQRDTKAASPPIKNWGTPLAAVDRVWTKIEERLCAAVLIAEVLTLVVWISVHGIATPYMPQTGSAGGLVFRAILTSSLLGLIAHLVTRPKGAAPDPKRKRIHSIAVALSMIAGLVLARLWANVGVEYATNIQDWMQNASILMLIGGPAGLVTRLTLWLALLGASLATSKGKHINFDLVMRLAPDRFRAPMAVVGWLTAAAVCFVAAYGFVGALAVTEYRLLATMPCDDVVDVAAPGKSPQQCPRPWLGNDLTKRLGEKSKLDVMTTKMGTDLFILFRQISLDFKTLPKIITGQSYREYLTGAEWNAWIKGADWEAHFPKEDVDKQTVPADAPAQLPAAVYPGGPEKVQGLLIRDANMVFPFGLVMIGLRFLLRVLLVLSRHVKVDPDAVHAEDEQVKHGPDAPAAAASEKESA